MTKKTRFVLPSYENKMKVKYETNKKIIMNDIKMK